MGPGRAGTSAILFLLVVLLTSPTSSALLLGHRPLSGAPLQLAAGLRTDPGSPAVAPLPGFLRAGPVPTSAVLRHWLTANAGRESLPFESVAGAEPLGSNPQVGSTNNVTASTWINQTSATFAPIFQALQILPDFAYDPNSGSDILGGGIPFGGGAQPAFSTYGFQNDLWSNVSSGTAPSGRGAAADAWDYADDEVVQFGGEAATGTGGILLGDTWTYQSGVWLNATNSLHPSPRFGASMAYDPAIGAAVLFGGVGTNGTLSDTWEFSGGTWTPVATSTGPAGRFGASLAWDRASSTLVLFGGENATNGSSPTAFNDTWSFSGGAWTQLHPTTSPSARLFAPFVNDTFDGQMLLVGGTNATGAPQSGTWNFTGTDWQSISVAGPPDFFAVATFDQAANAVVLVTPNITVSGSTPGPGFGGQTWQYTGGRWFEVNRLFLPGPLAHPGLAGDVRLGGTLLFGGFNGTGAFLNGTWVLRGDVWQERYSLQSPAGRAGGAVVDDPAMNGVVLFGGVNGTAYFNDTWVYSSQGWDQLPSPRAPSPRVPGATSYDASLGEVVLFGGNNATADFNDTWILFPNGTWLPDPGAGGPSPRTEASGAYDADLAGPVFFGGTNETPANSTGIFYNDTWALVGAARGVPDSGGWQILPSMMTPPGRALAEMSELPFLGADVLTGGVDATSLYNDTWELVGDQWTEIVPTPGAPGYSGGGLAYDPEAGALREYGGLTIVSSPTPGVEFVGYTLSFDQIEVGASENRSSGTTPLNVQFNGTFAGGAAPFVPLWAFGDGGESSLLAPTHTYYAPGTYGVAYGGTDAYGLSAYATLTETVTGSTITPLTASASASPTGGTAPLAVTFTGSPAGGVPPYAGFWSFGDSNQSTGSDVSHTYESAGTFVATFTATDAAAGSAQATVVITVTPGTTGPSPLAVTATASPPIGAAPLNVTFAATPTGGTPPYGYAWKFGDGGSASTASPVHEYTTAGTYAANVTVTDSKGIVASTTLSVEVSVPTGCGTACTVQPTTMPAGIPWTTYAILAAVVIAAVAGVAYVVSRRGRQPPPSAASPTGEDSDQVSPPDWSEGPPP